MSGVLQESAESKNLRGHLDPDGFNKHVLFHTYAPPEDLASFVEYFWIISWDKADGAYNSEQVMHRPQVDVFIAANEAGIQGTFRAKKTYVAAEKGRIIGIRFLPGAFHAYCKADMRLLKDSVLDIQRFFPEIDTPYIDNMLALDDQAAIIELITLLRKRVPQIDPNVTIINEIINLVDLNKLSAVTNIAAAYGKSERWIQQLFQEYVGVGLKWLLQRNKLLYAAEKIRESTTPQWASIAYDAGYSSQQHFITDFKKTTGKTPLEYKKHLTKPGLRLN